MAASAPNAVSVSTRAALALYRAAQALALVNGRSYVIPDDVKQLAVPVLAHRLLVRRTKGSSGDAAEQAVASIAQSTPLPG